MKILYLIPGPMGRSSEGQVEVDRRASLLRKYASPDTQVGIEDVPEGPASIESMYEEYLSIPTTLKRTAELETEGWDALIIGCFGDPGLDGARELVSIPVIGPCEASVLLAASLGHRFSIITITESVIVSTERLVRNVGVGEKLASVRAVDIPVLELKGDRERTIEATLAEGQKAIRDDRADTLILGCMSMGFLEVAESVAPKLKVPVINPAKAALKFAEALVGAGLSHSRQAYMTPPKLASNRSLTPKDLLHIK
ncbi:aspartate/glutamate racemase family protein [bacterium]|nr:aspartate/glutamate racemase family protein [bacterium]